MDEDKDGIAKIALKGNPKTIPTISPNHQWGTDRKNNLPKQRYRLEIKINPAETPTEDSQMLDYHQSTVLKLSQQQS
jgi:hypothetical protein